MNTLEMEARIAELENENTLLKEKCRILEGTGSSLLFEYYPQEDKMTFIYNDLSGTEKNDIQDYRTFVKVSPLVHPDHIKPFMDALNKASATPTKGEIEYLSRVTGEDYAWHRTYYSSVADEEGKVIRVLGRINNIQQQVNEKQRLVHRIETDFLTGLYNKEAAREKITDWLQKNTISEAYMIMVDLDDFKHINDAYGHSFGDEILKETSQVIKKSFEESAITARSGGDEFVIFTRKCGVRNVESCVDKMMAVIQAEVLAFEEPVTCSVGVTARMSKGDGFEEMFNRADNAMYTAKNGGKNRYFVYKE